MSPWQKLRTSAHLFVVAIRRRLVLGARAVLLDGDRVLLLRHTYLPGWHFPGGGVEPGETAEQAARREAEEETGFRIEGPMTMLGLYLQKHEATNRDHVGVFVAQRFTEVRPFRPNGEIAEIGWFPVDALPQDVDPGTAKRIAEAVGGERGLSGLW